MKRNNTLKTSLLAIALISSQAFAVEFTKPITTPAQITKSSALVPGAPTTKDVTLMGVKLSAEEMKALEERPIAPSLSPQGAPGRVDLGMNRVPVLDQGRHGSCVTFASSAAINAALGKGDYISQLCQLELGSYLESNSYMPSGWNGSWGPIVLEQMMRFGVVSKNTQQMRGCANLTEYPIADADNEGNSMSLVDYKQVSENLNDSLYWTHLLSNDQLIDLRVDPAKMGQVLADVKKALTNGHRLTFGVYLVIPEECFVGACASYRAKSDTWAITPEVSAPPYRLGGHEMVIVGYDDTAVAYDKQGKKHTGLLTLRNSWSDAVGDKGNFYMSYDYFKKFANEVQEIIPLKS